MYSLLTRSLTPTSNSSIGFRSPGSLLISFRSNSSVELEFISTFYLGEGLLPPLESNEFLGLLVKYLAIDIEPT